MTALAPVLQSFVTDRLIAQRRASGHTIAGYRDTFRLLLGFASAKTSKKPSALDIAELDAPLITAFLDHLEDERHNTVRTRNWRLAAIHSLFGYAALHHPEHAASIQRVLAIPVKRYDRTLLTWLTEEEVDALLAAPDRGTWAGSIGQADRRSVSRMTIPRRRCPSAERPAFRSRNARAGAATATRKAAGQRGPSARKRRETHAPALRLLNLDSTAPGEDLESGGIIVAVHADREASTRVADLEIRQTFAGRAAYGSMRHCGAPPLSPHLATTHREGDWFGFRPFIPVLRGLPDHGDDMHVLLAALS
jgi:hypothetical protein